jgi:hypothetical protein
MTNSIERTCEQCGRPSIEFDFFYEELVPGSGCVGRVYYCRECLGEECWHQLADVPEIAPGLFVGRSDRLPRS